MSYFIKQIGTNDCGFTCLKMLMAIVQKNKNYLFYKQEKKDKPYSFLELKNIAKNEGIVLNGYRSLDKEREINVLKCPFLMSIDRNRSKHMILIKKIYKKRCKIYDPAIGIYTLKKKDLIDAWDSNYLLVDNVVKKKYQAKVPKIVSHELISLTTCFQMISIFALMVGAFLVDKNTSFIIPIVIFTVYVMLEYIYNKLLILQMKKFDSITNRVICQNQKIDFKETYIKMNNLKFMLLSNPVKMVNIILLIIFSITILLLNDYINLINLAILIVVSLILNIIDYRLFNKGPSNIQVTEEEIFKAKNDEIISIGSLEKIQNKSYKYAEFLKLKRCILLLVSFIITLFYSLLTGIISLNYIVFHGIIYYEIAKNISSIVDLYRNNSEINTLKSLLYYHMRNK